MKIDSIETKYLLRKILPKAGFQMIYSIWKTFQRIKWVALTFINFLIFFYPNKKLKKQKKYIIIFTGWGIGDLLSLTGVVDYFTKKGKVVLITSSKEIFKNLGAKIINPNRNKILKFFMPLLSCSIHSNIIGCSEIPKNMHKKRLFLREALLHRRKDILSQIKDFPINSKIIFDQKEIEEYSRKFKRISKKKYGIIISGIYSGGLCQAKNIGSRKMQEVIDSTYKKINWIQTGGEKDPSLKKTFLNLKGKTTIRELFFLVSRANMVITVEGMLTHCSSAFGIPCITTYSGYHYPEISLYKNTIPIIPSPLPSCAYCWSSPCKLYKQPLCLKNIKASKIIKEANKIINKK